MWKQTLTVRGDLYYIHIKVVLIEKLHLGLDALSKKKSWKVSKVYVDVNKKIYAYQMCFRLYELDYD